MLKYLEDKLKRTGTSTSWEDFFFIPSKLLHLTGCTPFTNSSVFLKSYFAVAFSAFCVFSFSSVHTALTDSDIDHRFDSTLMILVEIQALIRIIYIKTKSTTLKELKGTVITNTVEINYDNSVCCQVGHEYRMSMMKIRKCFYVVWSSTCLVHLFLPLFWGKEWKLPVHNPLIGITYCSQLGYKINYILVALLETYLVIIVSNTDFTFYLFCNYTVSRYEICKKYSNLIGDKTSQYNTEEKQKKLLKLLVKTHFRAINTLTKMNEVYQYPILSTLLCSGGVVCFCIIQIETESSSTAYIPLIVLLAQVFLYTFIGEIILSKNEEFLHALYGSKWYELEEVSTKKIFLLILTRAHTFEGISCGGLSQLNLQTFTDVVKTCYSFLAFLANMVKKVL